jgi:hypothetical protein
VGTALALAAGVSGAAVSASAATTTGPGSGHAVILATGNAPSSGVPAGAAPAAQPQVPQTTTVTLPTGDHVRLRTGGGSQQATPIPAGSVRGVPRSAATFIKFSMDGDQYVVPDAAVPYLNSVLDPRLFDVSYLARAHLGTQGSAGIPVHITYTNGAQTASVPGLHVTSRSGATASGNITTAGASLLGGLLTSRSHAARSRHFPVPAAGLPGIKSISLAPPAGAPALPPNPAQAPARAAGDALPYYTLTLNATDQNGDPGTFAGIIQNVNNAALFTQETFLTENPGTGTESVSVPEGTYSLAISIVTPDPSGTGFDTALVIKPQVTVDSNTTVNLDARTAVPYTAKLDTTVSSTVRADDLNFWRSAKGGVAGVDGTDPYGILGMGLYSVSPNTLPQIWADRLLATPTAPVSDGSFMFDAQTMLSNSSSQGPGPMYVFDFPHQGTIPSSLTYTVPAAALTTVHSNLYQPPPSTGCTASVVNTNVFFPVGNGAWTDNEFLVSAAAGKRTDYWYSTDPGLDLWQYTAGYGGDNCSTSLAFNGPVWSIHPGQQITAAWNKAPLAPASLAPPYWGDGFMSQAAADDINFLGKNLGDPRALTVCTACRQGDIGTLNILPFGDSGPAQYDNWLYFPGRDSTLLFYRNGALALDTGNTSTPIGLELPLLSQPATYQLDWTEAGRTGDAQSGATIDTDWTFRSGPADPPARLRATETCPPDVTRRCSFLPLLFPAYNLPLNDNNQATAGTPEPINFTITGQQNSPLPRRLSATVSASFDGGQTWTTPQASESLGDGQFTTMITQPALSATNGFVSLRVTAQDASGDSVTQTIIDAYGLTS